MVAGRLHTDCWLEITTLLIPGENDSDAKLEALSSWIARELGAEVPLHFTAFHPDWRLRDRPATPLATLQRARRIASDAGLQHVYTGNVHDAAGGTTRCTQCATPLIVRDWYDIRHYALTVDGRCPTCATPLAGRFSAQLGRNGQAFGPRRVPVSLDAS